MNYPMSRRALPIPLTDGGILHRYHGADDDAPVGPELPSVKLARRLDSLSRRDRLLAERLMEGRGARLAAVVARAEAAAVEGNPALAAECGVAATDWRRFCARRVRIADALDGGTPALAQRGTVSTLNDEIPF